LSSVFPIFLKFHSSKRKKLFKYGNQTNKVKIGRDMSKKSICLSLLACSLMLFGCKKQEQPKPPAAPSTTISTPQKPASPSTAQPSTSAPASNSGSSSASSTPSGNSNSSTSTPSSNTSSTSSKPATTPSNSTSTTPPPPPVQQPSTPTSTPSGGTTVVSKCNDETDLARIVEQAPAGSTIAFNCGKATIPVKSTIFIRKPLTIDGAENITLDGKGSTRIFVVSKQEQWLVDGRINPTPQQGGAGIELSLKNITLTNGFGSNLVGGGQTITDGGAVYIGSWGHLSAENVTFSKNKSNSDGGAIAGAGVGDVRSGTIVKLKACTFDGNTAAGNGGAVMMAFGSDALEVSNSTFKNNKASCTTGSCQSSEGGGGAIRSMGSKISISGNSSFQNNESSLYGGALSAIQSEVQLSSVNFTSNTSNGTKEPRGGGALYLDGLGARNKSGIQNSGKSFQQSVWTNVTFSSNKAPNRGGAVYMALYTNDVLTLDTNLFSNNTVQKDRGSAICIDSSDGCSGTCSATFKNSKFEAPSGGLLGNTNTSKLAILDAVKTSPTITLTNTTVAGW
jgi:predicted outer membrane repeat protein